MHSVYFPLTIMFLLATLEYTRLQITRVGK